MDDLGEPAERENIEMKVTRLVLFGSLYLLARLTAAQGAGGDALRDLAPLRQELGMKERPTITRAKILSSSELCNLTLTTVPLRLHFVS